MTLIFFFSFKTWMSCFIKYSDWHFYFFWKWGRFITLTPYYYIFLISKVNEILEKNQLKKFILLQNKKKPMKLLHTILLYYKYKKPLTNVHSGILYLERFISKEKRLRKVQQQCLHSVETFPWHGCLWHLCGLQTMLCPQMDPLLG